MSAALSVGCTSSTPTSAPPGTPSLNLRTAEVSVAGLPGTLVLPTGRRPAPVVVLVGGSGAGDRDETVGPNKLFRDLAVGLADLGIASVRYDKRTGVDGGKTARLATFTPTQEYVPDAVAAIKLVRARPDIDRRRVFVLGHSQGGTFAPRIAAKQPAVAGVVLLAASAAPFGATLARQMRYLANLDGAQSVRERSIIAEARGWATLVDDPDLALDTPRARLPARLGARYWRDLARYNAVATARDLPQPLLVLQGARDYQVTVDDDLSRWKQGLKGRPKVTFRVFPRANHLLLDGSGTPNPQEYERRGRVGEDVIAAISEWIRAQEPRRG